MWPFKTKETIVTRARKINQLLEALDINPHCAEGKEIRQIVALELLSEEHKTIELYSKTKFTSSADTEKIKQALYLLQNNGLIKGNKLMIDDKKVKE